MNEIEKIPKDYHSITPVLIVKNGDEAIEFYKKGFGVEERCRMKGPDGRIAHAELKLGDSVFMLSDEYPEMECHFAKDNRWKSSFKVCVCR
jgi:PhnB protein